MDTHMVVVYTAIKDSNVNTSYIMNNKRCVNFNLNCHANVIATVLLTPHATPNY